VVEPLRQEIRARWEEEHRRVVELGGLHIIGTEKHESRRIDNQLRGRAGRQGDPGSSRFYISLEDDLLKRFGGERLKALMDRLHIPDDEPIENRMVSKAIEQAQARVEAFNFEIRKRLVEYDDVVNKHRDVIYAERRKILQGADLKANILEMVDRELARLVDQYLPGEDPEKWDLEGLARSLRTIFPLPEDLQPPALARLSRDEVAERLRDYAHRLYDERERAMGPEAMRLLERLLVLRTIDTHWVVHLTAMENLRQGVGLYAYGQQDPLAVYRTEGHRMFQNLLARIEHDIVHTVYHATLVVQPGGGPARRAPVQAGRGGLQSPMSAVARPREAVPAGAGAGKRKIGRNDPCPCGSGKKYKKCHGAHA